MPVIDSVFLVGWVIFWIYWLVASVWAKAGQTSWARFAGFRIAIVLILLLVVRAQVLKGHAVTTDSLLQGIGLAIFVLGLALAVWARIYLGRNWGMPMSTKDEPELVTSGPYRVVRHPIYSGIILAMTGTAIGVSLYWVVAVALLAAYFSYSALMEERYLTQQFPDAYPGYQRSTKMLIPFVL